MPNWQELETTDVLLQLQSVRDGLTDKEAEYRLQKIGTNELKYENKISPVRIFLSQFTNFLVIILILATLFSALVGEIIDAEAILGVLILNAIFGFIQEYKAEKSMEALKRLTNPESVVIRDHQMKKVPSSTLVPGDIVVLEEGDKIPADIRLLEVTEFKVDESAITGESTTVNKITTPCKTTTLADMKCMVFMGTIAAYGRAVGAVVRTGMETEVGKIAHTVQMTGEEQTPLQKSLDKFGKTLGIMILVICMMVIAAGLIRGGELVGVILVGVALAVAAIPEGLPAVVTVTLAIGMQHMAKKNAIIRKLHAVETLGSVSIICSDKTGTITKNEMTIRKIWINQKMIDVLGTGYEPAGDFMLDGSKVDKHEQLSMLLRTASLCTNSQLSKKDVWTIVGDPTEGAINVAAEKFGLRKENLEKENKRLNEVPFTSERKMMSTLNRYAEGYILCTKGAPEVVLGKCTKMQFGSRIIDLDNNWRNTILETNSDMTSRALRVLAIAYKQTGDTKSVEEELVFLGLVGMIDPPRPEVTKDIEQCKTAGIGVVMITGDHKNTALAIAHEIGLPEQAVLIGEELDKMTDEQFDFLVENVNIYARVNPGHKARIIDSLRRKGHIISMTGDGVNDAPALKKADIGVAMGIKGTDVAKEASDMVLADDNFSTIVTAIKDGRNIYDNIKTFILYLLSSNMAEVLVVFLAMLIGFMGPDGSYVIPFTAIQLLWINLVTDGLPAVALGTDESTDDIMKRKPRDPKEPLLSRGMMTDIIMTGVVMTIIVLALFAYHLPDVQRAVSISFMTIVVLELANIFRIRLEINHGIFTNRKLLYAVGFSFIVQLSVIYLPPLQPIFSTTFLDLEEMGMIFLGLLTFIVYCFVRIRMQKSGKIKIQKK